MYGLSNGANVNDLQVTSGEPGYFRFLKLLNTVYINAFRRIRTLRPVTPTPLLVWTGF